MLTNNSQVKLLLSTAEFSDSNFLKSLLSEKGYEVRTLAAGETVLQTVRQFLPDLILLATNLAPLNGYEICLKLKDNMNTAQIPVIFLLDEQQQKQRGKCFQVGCADVVAKPWQIEEITARINHQVTIQNLKQELIEEHQAREKIEKEVNTSIQELFSEVVDKNLLQEKLSNSEAEMQVFFEAMTDIILVAEADARSVRVIPTRNSLGKQEQIEIIDLTIKQFFPGAGEPIFWSQVEKAIKKQEKVDFEYSLCLRGKDIWFAASIAPITNLETEAVIWVARNITEQKQAELALQKLAHDLESRVDNRTKELHKANKTLKQEMGFREVTKIALEDSERRFRAIFNNVFQFIGLLLPDGTVLEANQTALNFAGIKHEDIVGKPFWEAKWWTISSATQARLKKAISLAAKGGFVRYEVEVLGKEDRIATIDFSLKPVRNKQGQVILLIPEGWDITARKETEQELQWRSQRDSLLRDISRTFLNGAVYEAIEFTLKTVGKFLGGDRCSLIHLDKTKGDFSLTQQWCRQGVKSSFQYYQGVKLEDYLRLYQQFIEKDIIEIPLVAAMPPEAKQEQNDLQKHAIQSLLIVPMNDAGEAVGFICLDAVYSPQIWNQKQKDFLRFVGELIVIAQERYKAKKQLKESQQRLSFLIEQTPLAVIEWSTDKKLLTWNQGAEKVFGYTAAEAIGKGTELLVPERVAQEVNQVIDNIIEQQGGTHSINKNITKDGRIITCEWFNTPLLDESGSVIALASIAMDITERKQREWLRNTRSQVLSMLAFGLPLPEVLLELVMQVERQMPELSCSILLKVPESNCLRPYVSANIPEAWNKLIDSLPIAPHTGACGRAAYLGKRVIVEDMSQDPLVAPWREQAAQCKLQACWSEPIKSEQGDILGTFALYFKQPQSPKQLEIEVIESLAQLAALVILRKQAEAALQESKEVAEAANRTKSDFLAKMSHELRTPLNAILGFSQLMTRDPSLSSRQLEHLSIINRSGEHLLTLINDVLSMAKIEAGKVALQENSFDLSICLNSLEKMLQLKAQGKGLQLHFEYHDNLPQFVKADESKLRQVLLNLLGNAIKFTQAGEVRLQINQVLSEDSTNCILAFDVTDSGAGIASEELDQLFDPFSQTDSGRKAMMGTGLGLPISQQFVALMGGEIKVISKVGQGSSFSFAIPVQVVPQLEQTKEAQPQKVVGLQSEQEEYRILIIEDVLENRQLVKEILQPLGFQVQGAENGQEGLVTWESWQPQLILMDMAMPVMNGYETTKRIKETPQGEQTTIIALTASAFEEQRAEILLVGCDDFLRKPFKEYILLRKIKKFLGVEYIYEENDCLIEENHSSTLLPLKAEDLNSMPKEWLENLYLAALSIDHQQVMDLIEKIPEKEANLALTLTNLVENFRVDLIVNCIEEGNSQ